MTRTQTFIVFFSIVLLLYGLLNTYVFLRGLHAIPQTSQWRMWFTVVFWCIASMYLAARLLEKFLPVTVDTFLIWGGSIWLGTMAYLIVILLSIDILRLLNALVPFFPSWLTGNISKAKQITALIVAGITTLAVIASCLNASSPRVQRLDLTIRKNSHLHSLHIAMASDIHLGTVISNSHLKKIVDAINSLNPDIVLLPGDIVDEDIAPVIRQNLGEQLKQIHSKYGTYAVTGNHEYIGGVEAACSYLTAHGIVMLRDTSVIIDNAFVVVGREDASRRQFGGHHRKTYEELLDGIKRTLPIISMDHQPMHLNEAEQAGIDLQLSGHTHNGQIWPFNYISRAVYEMSWGYLKKGNTQYYVSCGVGTWGPPMRSGNRPEIVDLRITFDEQKEGI
ncbi:MAG: metallophosphoesterase [Bacteroidota bacterium]